MSHVPSFREALDRLCEPDKATMEALCDHLTADRHEVLPAPTASDALRLCRYNEPEPKA